MRRLAVLTTFLVALSGPVSAQDNATVQKLADQLAEAFNKNAAAGVGDLYAEDAILVPPQADIRMGRKDIQAFWTQEAKQAEGLGIAVLDVKPLGTDAARAIVRGWMTTKDDKPRHLTGRNVVVLQKVGADWKFTTHIWNFAAESRQGAVEGRDRPERERRRDYRERPDDRGGARRGWDDNADQGRRYSGRDSDEFRPRYDDRFERRRYLYRDDY